MPYLRGIACLFLVALVACSDAEDMAARNDAATDRADLADGATLYQQYCASCHEGGVAKAPHSVTFQMMRPESILAAMDGVMAQQAISLDAHQRKGLAEHLAGQALGAQSTASPPLMCGGKSAFRRDAPRRTAAWGIDMANTRFTPAADAALDPGDVSRLALKWAFAYPDATRARSQPAVGGGAIFVGSQSGAVYALDEETGCARWIYKADAEVRSAPTLENWDPQGNKHPTLYFGDFDANVYAVDAVNGRKVWQVNVADHPMATITGSPKLHDGVLYVPVSSREWAAAADPNYACCTFRGYVAALNAVTGEINWISHSIPEEPRHTGRVTSAGTPIINPAGAPIWNSPTIDKKRNRLYVGTGEAYTSPAAGASDAIIAMDMATGRIVWVYQATPGDAWNMACQVEVGPNCPEEDGPDFDFGAPPVLVALPEGRSILLAGQKSGHVHALDPSNGALIWKRKIGLGGFAGGVHWGMAAAGGTLFATNADTDFYGKWQGERKPGLFALDVATGAEKWFTPAPDLCPQALKPACDPGLSAAPTAMPGVVFAGGFDGILRAYASETGKVLWTDNTVRQFKTVNGDIAQGGTIESDGPVIANGKLIINSGYLYGGRMAGNVLLVYSVEGK